MISLLKKLFRQLVDGLRWLTLSKALLIVVIATTFLAIGTYFYPQNFFKYFYDIPETDYGNAANYFDFFVRNGGFKISYFLLVTFFIAWVARLLVQLFGKKSVGVRGVVVFLALGVLISAFIYRLPPYYLPDLESFYDLDAIELIDEIPWEDELRVRETGAEFCGNRLDLFFLPYDGISIKAFNVIKSLESELPFEVNYRCLSERLNEDVLCEKNHGVKYSKESEKLAREWGRRGSPDVVLGCQKLYGGSYSARAYKEMICKDLGVCENEI